MIVIAALSPDLMFLAGAALLTIILLKRTFRYFGRKQKKDAAPIERIARPQSKWDGAQRDSLAIIERQKVEMYEMARDLNGELSSKIVILERLIGDSQRQIEHMQTLLAESKQETAEAANEAVS